MPPDAAKSAAELRANVLQDSTRAELARGQQFADIVAFSMETVHDCAYLAVCGELEHGTHLLGDAKELKSKSVGPSHLKMVNRALSFACF
jgi:hypothetical protein